MPFALHHIEMWDVFFFHSCSFVVFVVEICGDMASFTGQLRFKSLLTRIPEHWAVKKVNVSAFVTDLG